jgi:hypothetical protein
MTSMMNIMNNRIFALKADLNDSDQPLAVGAAHPWMPLTRGRRSPVDAGMTRGSHIRQSFCTRSHFRLLAARERNDIAAEHLSRFC